MTVKKTLGCFVTTSKHTETQQAKTRQTHRDTATFLLHSLCDSAYVVV